MEINLTEIRMVLPEEKHKEFFYKVKKAAMGPYVKQIWGWDEVVQRDFHETEWRDARPNIIIYQDKPIGSIRITNDPQYFDIEKFYLLPEFQNKGIGSHILKSILHGADGTNRITRLKVLKINPAISLYKRHGFETVREDNLCCYMERRPKNILKTS